MIHPGMVRTSFFDQLDFAPGEGSDQAIEAEDIADAVEMVLGARSGTVFDEITVTPLKKVIRHKDGKEPKPGR